MIRSRLRLVHGRSDQYAQPHLFLLTSDPDARVAPFYVFAEEGTCTDEAGHVLADEEICLGVRTCGMQLEAEIAREEPGQQALLDRLLDLVLIGTLRDWLALPEAALPGWHRVAADPVVGAALTAIHNAPS